MSAPSSYALTWWGTFHDAALEDRFVEFSQQGDLRYLAFMCASAACVFIFRRGVAGSPAVDSNVLNAVATVIAVCCSAEAALCAALIALYVRGKNLPFWYDVTVAVMAVLCTAISVAETIGFGPLWSRSEWWNSPIVASGAWIVTGHLQPRAITAGIVCVAALSVSPFGEALVMRHWRTPTTLAVDVVMSVTIVGLLYWNERDLRRQFLAHRDAVAAAQAVARARHEFERQLSRALPVATLQTIAEVGHVSEIVEVTVVWIQLRDAGAGEEVAGVAQRQAAGAVASLADDFGGLAFHATDDPSVVTVAFGAPPALRADHATRACAFAMAARQETTARMGSGASVRIGVHRGPLLWYAVPMFGLRFEGRGPAAATAHAIALGADETTGVRVSQCTMDVPHFGHNMSTVFSFEASAVVDAASHGTRRSQAPVCVKLESVHPLSRSPGTDDHPQRDRQLTTFSRAAPATQRRILRHRGRLLGVASSRDHVTGNDTYPTTGATEGAFVAANDTADNYGDEAGPNNDADNVEMVASDAQPTRASLYSRHANSTSVALSPRISKFPSSVNAIDRLSTTPPSLAAPHVAVSDAESTRLSVEAIAAGTQRRSKWWFKNAFVSKELEATYVAAQTRDQLERLARRAWLIWPAWIVALAPTMVVHQRAFDGALAALCCAVAALGLARYALPMIPTTVVVIQDSRVALALDWALHAAMCTLVFFVDWRLLCDLPYAAPVFTHGMSIALLATAVNVVARGTSGRNIVAEAVVNVTVLVLGMAVVYGVTGEAGVWREGLGPVETMCVFLVLLHAARRGDKTARHRFVTSLMQQTASYQSRVERESLERLVAATVPARWVPDVVRWLGRAYYSDTLSAQGTDDGRPFERHPTAVVAALRFELDAPWLRAGSGSTAVDAARSECEAEFRSVLGVVSSGDSEAAAIGFRVVRASHAAGHATLICFPVNPLGSPSDAVARRAVSALAACCQRGVCERFAGARVAIAVGPASMGLFGAAATADWRAAGGAVDEARAALAAMPTVRTDAAVAHDRVHLCASAV